MLFFDTDCIAYLDDLWGICNKKIFVSSTKFYFEKEENRILKPFKKARKRGGAKWNKAYQAVKHDRKKCLKQGNILNLINALGALYILNVYYMNMTIDFGKADNLAQVFDSRLGSEIFAVSFTDATINVQMGGCGTDDAIDAETREKFAESIYVFRYTKASWKSINDAIYADNESLRNALLESNEFKKFLDEHPDEIEKETHLLSLIVKVLGKDYLATHHTISSFERAFINAKKEAIVYKNEVIYG